jgi:pSer/pThr/pTyr-binding forkhead associated (FHA) protein
MAYDRVLIRDLGSRNGVRVNGRSTDESRLYEGDELAIGPILFRLETVDENPETIGVPSSRPAPTASRPTPNRPPPRSSRPDSDIDLIPLDDD